MPWVVPAITAVGAIGGALAGKTKAPTAPQPYAVEGAGGATAHGERAGMYSTGGAAEGNAGSYNSLVAQFLGQLGGAPGGQINLDPNNFAASGTDNSAYAPWAQAGQQMFGQGQGVLSAFNNFNPDTFAADQYKRLSAIAAPGEDSAARQTAQRLFGAGRLGGSDVASKDMFGRLAFEQGRANDARALDSINLAGTESNRLLGQGLSLTEGGRNTVGFGETLQSSQLSRLFQGISGAQGIGNYNTNNISAILGNAINAQQGGYQTGQDRRDAIANALTGQGLGTSAANSGAQINYLQNKNLGDLIGRTTGSIGDALGGLVRPSVQPGGQAVGWSPSQNYNPFTGART